MRAGRRDVLGPGSDPRTQPVSLVEQERKTAHGRPAVAEEEQREKSPPKEAEAEELPTRHRRCGRHFLRPLPSPPPLTASPTSHCGGHFLSLRLATDVKSDDNDSAEKSDKHFSCFDAFGGGRLHALSHQKTPEKKKGKRDAL